MRPAKFLLRSLRIGVPLVLALFLLNVAQAQTALTPRAYLPLVVGSGAPASDCPEIPGVTYTTLGVTPPPTDRPAEQHADLNLALRGYAQTTGTPGLVDYGGASDANAPQLYTLFGDSRVPAFAGVYQVYDWNWTTNSRRALITNPPVTLATMVVASGEAIHLPASGYNIGTATLAPPAGTVFLNSLTAGGYQALVLYASTNRITLKYTREDNVVRGYTIHVESVCIEPRLLALYQQMNSAGRANLPALAAGQAFGTGSGGPIGVAIRDNGSFMDPRSRKDWWQGK